ncbi:elongation factor G [Iamia sp. SCSIO 61187]|uniref:elongation factor G n=1 Tax=Iamia sp. SCSIO 61187 TaxID=2722752 RepID=UPI001C626008|nr:elongation factor G [Iamia sp. SCSIO 61187]QYG93415.1 elongation factor G [Iamia sp. SCSIO 61187]
MPSFGPDRIRNVALVGHAGAGKTTLAEALLHLSGAISRRGSVEDGTTVSDHDPAEKARKHSVTLSVLPFEWKGHRITLLDTPGDPDFASDVEAALRVADLAVFVVSAVDGVQVGTEAAWRAAAAHGVPRMVFVSKLDRERASFDATLEALRDRFGAGVAPLELPIGAEGGFRGVADLLSDTAYSYSEGTATTGEIPADMEEQEHRVHDNLVEGIVVADDDLLERYLEGDVPSVEELERTLAAGVDDATVFPVVCGSATAEIAVDRLADFICEIGPSPLDRPPITVTAGDTTVDIAPDPEGPPLAFVFKTVADQFVGHLSMFRVLSGTIRGDDHLVNTRSGADERLHALVRVRGADQEPVTELIAGEIGAVAKLSATLTGDTLAPRGRPVAAAPLEPPEAVHAVAISARTPADEDRLAPALHRLVEEDPGIRVRRDDETHQTLLCGVGEAHVGLALERLEAKFGVGVDVGDVAVAYRETITGEAQAEGRHKKQTGGHGQFAVCTLAVAPVERGAGFGFASTVVGGAISKGYISAVQKGVEETMARGGPLGHPVVDVHVTVTDGKEHAVDSSEMAFRAAARLALLDALAAAGPSLLEPTSRVEVTVPADAQGDVMGDLTARRGRIEGAEAGADGEQVVIARVPTSEMRRYAVELRSLTGGRGRFRVEPAGYEPLPDHLVEQARRQQADADD